MMTRSLPGSAMAARSEPSAARAFIRRAGMFMLIGILMYLGVYAAAETLVYRYARRDPFFTIATSAPSRFDYVMLGTSHAAVFGYRDMNARLEALSGARIANVSVVGGGLTVNTLLFEYFRSRHQAAAVVYVLDSFPFYSREWNEERLQDSRLFVRAPFDPALAGLLIRRPFALARAIDYVTGFSKINNPDRFAPDVPVDEGPRFDRSYRPVRQLDLERLAYLYPPKIDPAVFDRYLAVFETLLETARAAGMRILVIKPPLPDRLLREIPGEATFNDRVAGVLASHGLALHNFSGAGNEEAFFFDSDHLNQKGVLHFFQTSLGPLLKDRVPRESGEQ